MKTPGEIKKSFLDKSSIKGLKKTEIKEQFSAFKKFSPVCLLSLSLNMSLTHSSMEPILVSS